MVCLTTLLNDKTRCGDMYHIHTSLLQFLVLPICTFYCTKGDHFSWIAAFYE